MSAGRSSDLARGLTLALASAAAFGLSGPLATGLLRSGWSPLAAVLVRACLGAVVLLVPALRALNGRWDLIRRNWVMIVVYGVLAVAGAQLAYFVAVSYLPVAQALMIEYQSPVAIMLLLWLVKGHRPTRLSAVGALGAMAGLMLVLNAADGLSGLDLRGVAWALLSLVGAVVYFLLSARSSNGLPPLVLAGSGLAVGSVFMALVAVSGLLPVAATTAPAEYMGVEVPWWVPILVLGVVTAGLPYVLGITGVRLLGSRLASFVGLAEVLFATAFSALLVGQMLTPAQFVGAGLVVVGIVLVKAGERSPADLPVEPVSEAVAD